jgi:hypothetical protein
MTLVLDRLQALIPSKAKRSPSGWISFNAPCCHHRGQSADNRKRGGIKFSDGFVYNCFNCKYTASWQPGRPVSSKLKSLLKWMNASDDEINKIIFEALKTESPDYKPHEFVTQITFTEKELPEGSMLLTAWAQEELPKDLEKKLLDVFAYLINRGNDPLSSHFFWTPSPGFDNRVIVPFFFHGKIVGYTARKITDGRPKYVSDQHPFFVFNLDNQKENQQYTLVTEGPFDAIAVNGVGLLGNGIGEQQARLINELGTKPILIPDQDLAGLEAIEAAKELGWGVAFPNWSDKVKDCADAVQQYGRLFVTVDAIMTAQWGNIKIELAKKKLETHLKSLDLKSQR